MGGSDLRYISRSFGIGSDGVGPAIRVVAVEPNTYLWESIRSEFNIHLAKGVLTLLPALSEVKSGSCDVAVLQRVLCSVEEPSEVLKSVRRCLKPGGLLIFTEHVAAPEGSPLLVAQSFF